MAFKQQSPLDMTGLEILNARLQNLAGSPSSPGVGQVWYDTVSGRFMFRGASADVDPTARANHVGTQLAATVSDLATTVKAYKLNEFAAPVADVPLGGQKITGLANPGSAQDAATKAYADTGDAAVSASILTTRLDQFAAPNASVNLNAQKIIGLADPTLAQDAATKAYADLIAAPVALWRASCKTQGNFNHSMSGLSLSTDTLTVGDRVLLTGQTTPSQNGIWIAAAGAWSRASDSIVSGIIVPYKTAVSQAPGIAVLTTTGVITVGTTSQTYKNVYPVSFADLTTASGATVTVGSKLSSVTDPTAAQDAATKNYVDLRRLDQAAAPTAAVSLNSQKITNLANGTVATDAATYGQLLNAINGTDWKGSVRVATTANLAALSGLLTIDGITLVVGDRVLVKNQTTPSQNGLYVAASGAWAVAADAVTGMLSADAAVFVEEGTTQADSQWRLTTDGTITVGTTAQTWAQIGASVAYANGAGITLAGNVFAIDTAVVVRKFAATVGDNSATSIAVSHNLGTLDVTVGVYEVSTGAEVGCDKVRTSTNVVTLGFAVAPTTSQFRVVIHA